MNEDASGTNAPFSFNGSGGEYFKIWIVNVVLTILTLGIYSAWATVRKRRYFYGNTELDGNFFEYKATPWMILKGRLIAVFILIVFSLVSQFFPPAGIVLALALLAVAPWIIWNSFRFSARMSAYRNVLFGFKGKLGPVYFYILLLPILPLLIAGLIAALLYFSGYTEPNAFGVIAFFGIIATYLLFPFTQAKFTRYYVNGATFGQGGFEADITSGRYYATYIKAFFMIIGLSLLMGTLLTATGSLDFFEKPDAQALTTGVKAAAVGAFLIFILFSFWLRAYVSSRIRNYIFNSSCLDNNIQLSSSVTVNGLFMLYLTNTLLLIISLGLAYPWTAVRIANFHANNTAAIIQGDLSGYITEQNAYQSSLADELGDAFDLEVDVAF